MAIVKIKKIHFNYHQVSSGVDAMGEDYQVHEIGKKGVKEIDEIPNGHGVYFENGNYEQCYNTNRVFFEPVKVSSRGNVLVDQSDKDDKTIGTS